MSDTKHGKYYESDFKKVTTEDIINELAREQALRASYYKKQIEAGRLEAEEARQRFRIFRVMLHLFNKAEFNDLEPEDLRRVIDENIGDGPKQKKLFPPQQPN
jgi:hypothetical protein